MRARTSTEAELPATHCSAFCLQHCPKTGYFLCGWQFLYLLPFFYRPFYNFPHPFHESMIFIRAENFTAAEGTGATNHCLVVTPQTIPRSTALYLPEKPRKWHRQYPAFISAKGSLIRWAGKLELKVVENSQRWKRNGSQPQVAFAVRSKARG